MFWEFFRFELRYQLRSPLPWVIALVFALLAFAATTSDIITIGEGIGNVQRNAPYVILTFLDVFSTLGMFVAVALIAQPLLPMRSFRTCRKNAAAISSDPATSWATPCCSINVHSACARRLIEKMPRTMSFRNARSSLPTNWRSSRSR